jgi:hypothetical protein
VQSPHGNKARRAMSVDISQLLGSIQRCILRPTHNAEVYIQASLAALTFIGQFPEESVVLEGLDSLSMV